MEQWNNGTMEQWNNGTMEQFNNGAMEQCDNVIIIDKRDWYTVTLMYC